MEGIGCHRRVTCVAAVAGVMLVLGVTGCGGSARHSGPARHAASGAQHRSTSSTTASHAAARTGTEVCAGPGRAVLSARLRVPASRIATRPTRDTDAAPECVFSVQTPARRPRPVVVSVVVDSSPQPYAVLERAASEEAQMFTQTRTTKPPQSVAHLGLDAYWFPQEQHLETTDGRVLVTVTVERWPGAGNRTRKRLTAALARPYLGKPDPKLAIGPA